MMKIQARVKSTEAGMITGLYVLAVKHSFVVAAFEVMDYITSTDHSAGEDMVDIAIKHLTELHGPPDTWENKGFSVEPEDYGELSKEIDFP